MWKDKNAGAWLVAALLAFLLFSALRWPYLEMPLDRDEGTYLVIGKQVAGGQTPYSDVYEMKPPGLFYSYAILAAAGAYDFMGARIVTLLIYGMNGVLLFLLLRRRDWRGGALAAQVAFYALSMDPYMHGFALLPEPLMVFCFLSGLWVLSFAKKGVMYALMGGFLLGWSVWIKQNMVFPMLFLVFWAAYAIWVRRNLSLRRAAYAALGVALGPMITLSWILLQGAGGDLLYWVWTYPAQVYTQSISWEKALEYAWRFVQLSAPHSGLWVVFGFLGIIGHFWLKRGVGGRAAPLFFFAFSFLAVSPGLRFYGHYWILLLPAIALGVGALWEFLAQEGAKLLSPLLVKASLIGLLLALLSYHLVDRGTVYFSPDVDRWSRKSYGNNPFLEIRDIAEKLKAYGQPDASVAVMGSEPQLYVYLKQVPFTKHTFITFLNKRHPRRGAMQAEFTSDVQRENPLYMVFVNHPYSWSITEGDHQDLHAWAYRYNKNQYRPIALYEMGGTPSDRRIWTDDPKALQPRTAYYIQVSVRR